MTKKKKTGKGVIYFDHPVKTRFFVTEEEKAKWAKDKSATCYEGRSQFMRDHFIQDHVFVEEVRKLSKTQIEDELGVQAAWGEVWWLGS